MSHFYSSLKQNKLLCTLTPGCWQEFSLGHNSHALFWGFIQDSPTSRAPNAKVVASVWGGFCSLKLQSSPSPLALCWISFLCRLRETSGLGVMEHKIDHRLSIVNKLSFSESDCARSYINTTEAGQPPHPVPYQSKNYRLSLPSWYQVNICWRTALWWAVGGLGCSGKEKVTCTQRTWGRRGQRRRGGSFWHT